MSSEKKRVVYQEFGSVDIEQPETVSLPANQQNLRIQTSKAGRKGKTVTIISGFVTSTETLNQILKQLKTLCGTGGTIKDNTIEIQGDHREKVLQNLTKLGYKAKLSGG